MKKQLAVLVVVLLVTANQATSQPLFGDPTIYGVGDHPRAVFSVDLDGDSDKDLAVANLGSKSVSILLNDGNGAFVAFGEYDAGGEPVSVFSVDVDGDLDNDLAVANSEPDSVSILLNNGDGTFAPLVEYYAGSHPTSVFSVDLDGDLDNDLAVADYESDSVSILLNNGDGTFAPSVEYGAGDGPLSIFSVDLDGDSDNDLAVANRISSDVSILLNNGDGTFGPSEEYDVAVHPTRLFSVDLDGDLDNDLAVTTDGDKVSILLNIGDGTFAPSKEYGVGDQPNSVFSVDLDGDLDNDLAVANYESDDVSILLNNGDGTFASSEEYSVDVYPHWVFSADFDGDGDNDLVTANNNTDNISVLFNQTMNIGSICAYVNIDGDTSTPAQGITVTMLDQNNDPVSDPLQTDENGDAIFNSVDVGEYSVMIVTPLGYSVSPSETQTNIEVVSGQCTDVDFVLTPTIITNTCRTIGYWKHQFNVYTSGRGNAQESSAELESYLDLVHQHFSILGIYLELENYDFEDAKDILTVRGGSLLLDRAKQQLFALLLNFASGRIGNETFISDDGRVAAEAVTFVSNLINDGNAENDEMAKNICDLINNGQMVEAGIISESNIRYKLTSNGKLPKEFSVSQNFPNPFNAVTTIKYGLPIPSQVMIEIYDVMGRKVETVLDGMQPAGYHSITWNSGNNSSGVYFYKIQASDYVEIRKMLLVK